MPSKQPANTSNPYPLSPPAVDQEETAAHSPLPDFSFLLPALEPGELGWLAQYRVTRLIGAGGMGMVFEAEDTHLLRPVALKVMRPEIAASLSHRSRFLQEARAAAAIVSDHIVPVYQVGQDNDVPFMVMQLLRGEPLDARLSREPRLPVAEALVIAIQAATGLEAAHEKGLVHRDIKPGNLWLEAEQAGGEFRRVRILDLGLVRGLGGGKAQLTTAGVVVGTPHFMAPEQAAGQPVDARADLFSLGCVIFTMLSGELAFSGDSTMAVLMALASHTPPPLTAVNPAVPPELAALVTRLMAKSREDRPASAREVIEQLEAILATCPVQATAPKVVRASGAVGWATRRVPSGSGAPAPVSQTAETITFGSRAASLADTHPQSGMPTPAPTLLLPATPPPSTIVPPSAAQAPEGAAGAHRGRAMSVGAVLAVLAVLVALGLLVFGKRGGTPTPAPEVAAIPEDPIIVGVLHSQTETMSVSENPVVDATLLAIEEVNAAGGVGGRQVKAVVVDGKSDPEEFARLAEKLLADDKAVAVFGCWTSASRKAVRPVFERRQGLLFYPVQYEGLEQSPQIVYLGPAPNQQLLPSVEFFTGKLGKKKLFLVGSDYVFPRTAHEIIRDRVRELPGVNVVGEAFIPLGSDQVAAAVEAIKKSEPDAIVNALNGSSNVHFFRELRAAGVTADKVPTLSVSIAESEVEGLNPAALAGDYLAASYFQTVDRAENREFIRKFRARYGESRVVSDPMTAAYSGVHLWAASANAARSVEPSAVRAALRGRQFDGPRTRVKIDEETQHAWLPVRIGQIRPDGQVSILPGAGSEAPIKPVPFPPSRTPVQWEQFLKGLQFGWNGKWQPPAR
jgi:urea transport system substrate-binding protein